MNSLFQIKFQIKYETAIGQDIYIVGSVPELGSWKDLKFKLKWTTGDIWENTLALKSDIKSFYYKFVCYDTTDGARRWEQGANRYFNKLYLQDKLSNTTICFCKWEIFEITFSIFYPLEKEHEYLQIIGNHPTIGNWFKNKGSPLKMTLSKTKDLNGIVRN